jgi:predicted CoA-binding protein
MTESEMVSLIRLAKTIGVVGMQDEAHADRPAFAIPQQLLQRGYDVYPINPTISSSLGRTAYASVSELPIRVDILDVFRPAQEGSPSCPIAVSACTPHMQAVRDARQVSDRGVGSRDQSRASGTDDAQLSRQRCASLPAVLRVRN